MGSMSLVCPMCCGETFDNSQSLKYHLLSMTDNLYCPNCAERSDSVGALIQHLERCGQSSREPLVDDEEDEQHTRVQTILVGTDTVEKMDTEENEGIEKIIKDEKSTEEVETNFVEKDDTEYGIQVKEEANEEDPDALYSCSSCGMSFNSVLSHIKEYHDGQEVVLEMAEGQMNELPQEIEEGEEEEEHEEEEEQEQEQDREERPTGGLPRQRQTMNTLRTEECIDSEGRLYTRKVVQIERFWDRGSGASAGAQSQHQQSTSKSAPMIEKFFSNAEGLKIRTKTPAVSETSNDNVGSASTAASSSSTNVSGPLKMYRCNKCLEQFVKLADFRVHACIYGNNQCDLCEQAFASAKALQMHSKVHEAEAEAGTDSNFVCHTCGTEFSSHKSLRLHSRMHAPVPMRHVDAPEGTDNESFTCLECGKTLSESYRNAHMTLHKGDSIICSICNRKFDSGESLAMHAAVHLEGTQLRKQRSAERKMEEETSESREDGSATKKVKKGSRVGGGSKGDAQEKPYQCQHCARRFTRPHEKVKHERIHTGEKPHACEVCGKTFRVSYCLTLHMRTHTGVRPYACQHCDKRFKASSVYNHHLLTHSEERAYTCPYCPKTFKTRVQLAGHRNSHTKPFRCTECSRPFASLYAARAHIQTHKKDNNLKFSCYICGASYGRAFALKDHLKQHTGQDVLVPPPEPAREEEVTDADDFIVPDETEQYQEIEEIEEIEEEEHKLVAIAAAADDSRIEVYHSNLDERHDRSE